MAGIGLVTNPNSRRNRKNPRLADRLSGILGNAGTLVATSSREEVAGAARRFKREKIDILALNGGDGTNHFTLSTFIEVYDGAPLPIIAFLRGGTMNTISEGCGVRGIGPVQVLMNVVEKYSRDDEFEFSHRNILKIGDDKYGFIFGNGVVHNFLRVYYQLDKPEEERRDVSPVWAARTLARAIMSGVVRGELARRIFEPFRARVVLDGDRWPWEEYMAVAVSTINQLGLDFQLFYRFDELEDGFQIIGLRTTALETVLCLPKVRRGLPTNHPKIMDRVGKRVVFESDRKLYYTIDGDTYSSEGSLEISTGPRLKIIKW